MVAYKTIKNMLFYLLCITTDLTHNEKFIYFRYECYKLSTFSYLGTFTCLIPIGTLNPKTKLINSKR